MIIKHGLIQIGICRLIHFCMYHCMKFINEVLTIFLNPRRVAKMVDQSVIIYYSGQYNINKFCGERLEIWILFGKSMIK